MIRIITKTIFALLIGLTCQTSAVAQQSDPATATIVELDRIAAIVNEDVIMDSELVSRIRTVREELRAANIPPPPEHILKKQVLDRLILQRLQLAEAKRSGLQVDDQTLNRTIRRIAESNDLTLQQFRQLLERDGISFAEFRNDVHDEILVGRVRNREVKNRIKVTEQEIDHLLDTMEQRGDLNSEYHLGHILIAIPDNASTDQVMRLRSEAEQTLEELRGGADFRQTATAVSNSQTALQGGDLGWRKRAELPSVFEDIVPKMAAGQTSDIIRTPGGFHIIRLFETRGGERVVITQTLVRHILIKPTEVVSDSDARARLEQLRNRILSGEDFAALARSNSDDTASAVEGGTLNWVSPGELAPDFEDVMEQTAVGEVSEPFRSPFGWHILKVDDRREHDSTREFRRNRAREIITKRKAEEEMELWLRRLRDEAYIEYRLEE